MEENKDFANQIKRKSFDFFVCQIYRPLMIQKNQDIEDYDKRKDYEQVLAIADKDMSKLNEFLDELQQMEHAEE